jgi:dipeptidyl aminopeptidase/acylaminoacyl peptidase
MYYAKRAAGLLAAALLIAACGGVAATPTAAPTTAALSTPTAALATATVPPTTAPEPTAAPTDEPTEEPTAAPTDEASADVLPAPLYTVLGGQIVRFERDGTTRTPITAEPSAGDALAVTDFAVSPQDNALAYLVQKPGGGTALIGADAAGKDRTVLFDQPNAGAGNPVWSPDGATIAVGLTEFAPDGGISGGGLYLIPAGGGEPKLLQANSAMPLTTTTDIDPDAVGYTPLAFSPDGSSILATRYSLQIEQCELAIIPVAGGAPVRLRSPDPALRPTCGPATWSPDSSTVYTSFEPNDGVYGATAGLWRVDAATGEATALVPAKAKGQVVIVSDPVYVRPGEIDALIGRAARLPEIGDPQEISYQMARIDADSGAWTPLRTETYTDTHQFAWAPDASGAIAQTSGDDGRSTLTWLPADGSAGVKIAEGLELSGLAWGR